MRKIYNKEDFDDALQHKEQNVLIENAKLSNLLILVYRMQNGLIPEVVIDRITLIILVSLRLVKALSSM